MVEDRDMVDDGGKEGVVIRPTNNIILFARVK